MTLADSEYVSRPLANSAFALVALCVACSSPSNEPHDPNPQPIETASVAIGVPSGADGLEFAPLAEGSELRLQSFGQGGTHVMLGVRCVGFGNRAFIGIMLENLRSGTTMSSPPPAQPQLLYCHDDVGCDLVPILAMASGLTLPGEERDGLPVKITVEAHSSSGASANASVGVVLSTADL